MYVDVLGKNVALRRFEINKHAVYAIKKITGDKENEIVSYFYEMGMKLFNDSISRKRIPQRCMRKVLVYYKDTDLQLRFDVWSDFFRSRYSTDDNVGLNMSLTFPNDRYTLVGKNVLAMIAESGLSLDDSQIVEIAKPEEKVYKCLKKNESLSSKKIDALPVELMKFTRR